MTVNGKQALNGKTAVWQYGLMLSRLKITAIEKAEESLLVKLFRGGEQ